MSPTLVTTLGLTRDNSAYKPVGQLGVWVFPSLLEGSSHVGHDGFTGENVALCGIVLTHLVSGPCIATFTGETLSTTLSVHHADLQLVAPGIGVSQDFQVFLLGFAISHQLETLWTIGGIGIRLGGDCSNTSLGPGYDGANPKKFTLNGDT